MSSIKQISGGDNANNFCQTVRWMASAVKGVQASEEADREETGKLSLSEKT